MLKINNSIMVKGKSVAGGLNYTFYFCFFTMKNIPLIKHLLCADYCFYY